METSLPSIKIIASGNIDQSDSAFPQAVQLPGGDILCSFSVGGGPNVTGGTDWARSGDQGKSWQREGTILSADSAAGLANFLKLSYSSVSKTVFAYGSRISNDTDRPIGQRRADATYCRSIDDGRTWSAPRQVPMPVDCPLEVSHAILPLRSGRLLAPAATLPAGDLLGEQVIVAISDDDGQTWPRHSVVLRDPEAKLGFFEQKLTQLDSGLLLATAWTVTLGDYVDQPNSYTISSDDGQTWSPAQSTGIQGQTMTPIPLGNDRLLVLYNRRYGQQAIVACLVSLNPAQISEQGQTNEEGWTVHHEINLYDAGSCRQRGAEVESGIDELDDFAFGFPTAIQLQDGTFLCTYWSVENGVCGIRWLKLSIDW